MMGKTCTVLALGATLLVLTGLHNQAAAADLGGAPARRPPPDYEPPYRTDLERWTGFYIGGTAGYSFGTGSVSGDIGDFSFDQNGVVGTLLAGYNWQIGRSVLGIEADVGTGDFGTSGSTGALDSQLNVFGSLRARAGYLISPALLIYATAGAAWADMDFKIAGTSTQSETFFGYQVGGGGELAISPRTMLRLEYIFTDLGSERVTQSGLSNTFDPDFHTVRAGVAFKF
ncbi:MAG: outer membrane beta-barrel protein [Bacteroidota bacterium]